MSDIDAASLTRECDVLARRIGAPASSAFITAKYILAHEQGHLEPVDRDDALDRLLVRFAALGPAAAALADTYARFARPAGTLRRKLVLTAALLESTAPGYMTFEPPSASHALTVVARLAGRGALFALVLGASILVLGPVHLVLRLTRRSGRRDAPSVVRQ
ncbi:MAG TPA: hypothetical protein VK912_06780 [Longimicrobiales bacterium]|nr:hypothetical protein [Longimicrobiales bacterium]